MSEEQELLRLTKESVRLQRWQLISSVVSLTLVVLGYLSGNILILLLLSLVTIALIILIWYSLSAGTSDAIWYDKISALSKLKLQYEAFDYEPLRETIGRLYRNGLETCYGHAILEGKTELAKHFKNLMEDLDSIRGKKM